MALEMEAEFWAVSSKTGKGYAGCPTQGCGQYLQEQ